MGLDLNPNLKGEDIRDKERRDMLVSYYENNFHLIPCGSKEDNVPDYFKHRHPNEQEDVIAKRWSKTTRTHRLLGADYETVQAHLETTMYGGMTRDSDTHIDHIIPLASANTEKELEKLMHYSNLQLLFAEDNLEKSDKINWIHPINRK